MKGAAVCATLAAAGVLFGLQTQAATPVPQELQAVLPAASLSGQAKMTFLGFEVYQATLWVEPGFVDSAYDQSAFALELEYLRDFKGADIARRSIAEMRRQAPLEAALQARWETRMRTLFPDVKSGDRITGVHLPGTGALFWINGLWLGEIRDSTFAKLFFDIWLAPQTSEPQLRQALLAPAGPMAGVGITP
jgi:hypothetical protein